MPGHWSIAADLTAPTLALCCFRIARYEGISSHTHTLYKVRRMNLLTIATAISIIALGYVTVPRIRRAQVLRKARVPKLPKRTFTLRLPQEDDGTAKYLRELARRRMEEAQGIENESGRGPEWP